MTRKLVLVFVLLVAFSSWIFAANKAADNVVKPVEKPKANLKYVEGANQEVDVYFTDFETEGEWGAINYGAGPDFNWVEDNSHSATHSWFLADDEPMTEEDAVPADAAIVSPMIELPADFDGYEPKVLQMEYWADVETPNTADGGYVYDVFQMEIEVPYDGDNLWHTDTEGGYNGTSSWWCGDPETGSYDTNTRQQLVTPVLDLSAAAADVMLTFK
ncbi:hypothetical protein JW935_06250, partial [candidate division KSB1 bacterium]|nr:hypothetical protein [candidate division KSB1 bacterium]